MNIPCPFQEDMTDREKTAHKCGHRDARHAAAELANDADSVIVEAKKIIEELCARYGHPPPVATLERMSSF